MTKHIHEREQLVLSHPPKNRWTRGSRVANIILYNMLFTLTFILAGPVFLYKLIRYDKWREGLAMRFGFYSRSLKDKLQNKQNIWVHAASVGEVKAVLPLLRKVQERFPSHHVVLSTVTRTGNTVARNAMDSEATVLYFPLDFFFSVRKAIQMIHPEVMIFVESELWPNCLWELYRRKVPVFLINVRMSMRSFQRYRAAKFLFGGLMRQLTWVTAPTRREVTKIKVLGVDSSKIHVVGNLKYDNEEFNELTAQEKKDFLVKLGFPQDGLVIIAGSTHEGEEKILIKIYQELFKEIPNLFLILAPRHPERAGEVVGLLANEGIPCQLRTRTNSSGSYRVLVLDTIGELDQLYSIGHVVFIGKSLTRKGGQNFLEPARCGKPIVFGPHMQNFEDMAGIFVDEGAAIQVRDEIELREVIKRLLESPTERELMGYKAKETLAWNKGALDRTLQLLEKTLHSQLLTPNS